MQASAAIVGDCCCHGHAISTPEACVYLAKRKVPQAIDDRNARTSSKLSGEWTSKDSV
jgi:hypothetical protein